MPAMPIAESKPRWWWESGTQQRHDGGGAERDARIQAKGTT